MSIAVTKDGAPVTSQENCESLQKELQEVKDKLQQKQKQYNDLEYNYKYNNSKVRAEQEKAYRQEKLISAVKEYSVAGLIILGVLFGFGKLVSSCAFGKEARTNAERAATLYVRGMHNEAPRSVICNQVRSNGVVPTSYCQQDYECVANMNNGTRNEFCCDQDPERYNDGCYVVQLSRSMRTTSNSSSSSTNQTQSTQPQQ